MAKIVSGKSRKVSSKGLINLVEPEVISGVPQTADREKEEGFFNWRAARGYVSEETLRDPACGENIYGYLAQRGVLVTDDRFYAKSVKVLEKRAVELIGETSFKEYKDALTLEDDIYRQFRVLRTVFEGEKSPLANLILDQIIWDTFESCSKEYSSHISEFGSSTIDWRSDIRESCRYLGMLIQCGEDLKSKE